SVTRRPTPPRRVRLHGAHAGPLPTRTSGPGKPLSLGTRSGTSDGSALRQRWHGWVWPALQAESLITAVELYTGVGVRHRAVRQGIFPEPRNLRTLVRLGVVW